MIIHILETEETGKRPAKEPARKYPIEICGAHQKAQGFEKFKPQKPKFN